MYRIEVQAQINVQVGKFHKINKHAVQNKYAGEPNSVISCFKRIRMGLILVDAKN